MSLDNTLSTIRPRRALANYSLLVSIASLVTHFFLSITQASPVAQPIAALSQHPLGWLHTLALLGFATGHIALALSLPDSSGTHLVRIGCTLLALSSGLVVWVAEYFLQTTTFAQSPTDNIAMQCLASGIGVVMGLFAVGYWRHRRALAKINAIALLGLLGLVSIMPTVTANSLGAYERQVAVIYLGWMIGLALISRQANQPAARYS